MFDLTEEQVEELKGIKDDKKRAARRRELNIERVEREKVFRLKLLQRKREKKHAKRKERRRK